jgi:hypothetical protein
MPWYKQRGVITVEFALLAPLLLLLVLCCLEMGRMALVRVMLERSIYDISFELRLARGENFDDIVTRNLEANSHFLYDPADISVSATHARTLSAFNSEPQDGAGGAGDIVKLELSAELGVLRGLRLANKPLASYQLTMLTVNEIEFF